MPNIPTAVLVWELGHGLGHLHNLRCIAVELVVSGFNVVVITKNIETARVIFSSLDVTINTSPRIKTPNTQWLDVKEGVGYLNVRSNSLAVEQWVSYFNYYNPALVVFESSPIALYASHHFNFIKILLIHCFIFTR